MNCNNIDTLINQDDFNCVGEVARHCDLPKLCIAINEAQTFDLSELFCDFWDEILDIWKEVEEYQNCVEVGEEECVIPENYDLKLNLICGGDFQTCSGKTRKHLGVKRILVYYAYSRYLIINGYNDTPNGSVNKTNDFSIPKPLKEVKDFADKYRTMGFESFNKTINFICSNKEDLGYEGKCGGCGCGDHSCKSGTKAKGYGFKSRIIRK